MKQEGSPLFRQSVPFDYDALMHSVSYLIKQYPFLEFNYLGNSILGRGIPILSLGTGPRTVLYVGVHHGMEWITAPILLRFLDDFCKYVQCRGCINKVSPYFVLQTHTIFIVPMLNPDGVEYQIHGIEDKNPIRERVLAMNENNNDFSHWQANARGVDLNHNYNAGFAEYKQLEVENGIKGGCATRFSGESPESEPEVAALCNFIRYQKNLCGVMTLHTQGQEIFYKSGGKVSPRAQATARHLSKLCGYALSEADGLASYGGLTDWCIQKMNIPSFTMECGKGQNPLPVSDLFPIYATLRQALFAFPTLL